MKPMDQDELLDCVECGSTVDPTADRPFAVTDEIILCYACSMRRGGEYDGTREKWAIAPRLDGLPGTAEQHAHP
jgi:hypothetical protein